MIQSALAELNIPAAQAEAYLALVEKLEGGTALERAKQRISDLHECLSSAHLAALEAQHQHRELAKQNVMADTLEKVKVARDAADSKEARVSSEYESLHEEVRRLEREGHSVEISKESKQLHQSVCVTVAGRIDRAEQVLAQVMQRVETGNGLRERYAQEVAKAEALRIAHALGDDSDKPAPYLPEPPADNSSDRQLASGIHSQITVLRKEQERLYLIGKRIVYHDVMSAENISAKRYEKQVSDLTETAGKLIALRRMAASLGREAGINPGYHPHLSHNFCLPATHPGRPDTTGRNVEQAADRLSSQLIGEFSVSGLSA